MIIKIIDVDGTYTVGDGTDIEGTDSICITQ
jgi:hypothetical protein